MDGKMTVTVKEGFNCPRCDINFDQDDEIEVSGAPVVHECENCGLEIYLILNDDFTVEL